MSRLTHTLNGESVPRNFDLDFVLDMDNETWHGFKEIMNRLAALEDILYAPDGTERISLDLLRDITKTVDTVGVDRLREIVEADADGRCVVLLPDGQIYYIEEIKETGERWIGNRPCQYITGDGYHCGWGLTPICFPFSELGKTIFLTRAEADVALEKKGE